MFDKAIQEKRLIEGYGIPDGCIVHFIDEKLHNNINARNCIGKVYKSSLNP